MACGRYAKDRMSPKSLFVKSSHGRTCGLEYSETWHAQFKNLPSDHETLTHPFQPSD